MCVRDKLCVSHVWHVKLVSVFFCNLPHYNSIIFLKEILVLVSMGTWYTVCMKTSFKKIMELQNNLKNEKKYYLSARVFDCFLQCVWETNCVSVMCDMWNWFLVFRWFKFTLKPPYTITSRHLLSAIWDTSHWISFVKFGLETAWDISYDILWPILKYVNFWWLQGHSSTSGKNLGLQKINFSWWRSDKALMRLICFWWAGP